MSGIMPRQNLHAVLWFALGLIGLPAAVVAEGQTATRTEATLTVRTEKVPMRDGVRLSTDVFLPEGRGPFPAVLVRSPYSAAIPKTDINKLGREFAGNGYAFVVQDCRGTGDSEGKWEPFVHERDDGTELHKWVLRQPWCNSNIGTFGVSYLGYTQWAIASQADHSLKAMLAEVPAFSWHEVQYLGGTFRVRNNLIWDSLMCRPRSGEKAAVDIATIQWENACRLLPLRTWDKQMGIDIPWLQDTLAHPEFDEYWTRSHAADRLHKIAVPNLTCSGWFDVFLDQALRHVPALRKVAASDTARRHQHLIIGPWGHGVNQPIGELPFGNNAKIELPGLRKQWFGYWLKGEETGVGKWPFLRIFVMGVNVWRDENEWPLARTRPTPYYLYSGGSANTLNGDGRLSTDQRQSAPGDAYVYDPQDPVPTHGGQWDFSAPCGPLDQREIESRKDVLVYTSESLSEPLEVTGPVKVILYAASNAPDTDWTAKLVDVHADDRAFNLCDGIIRARYRESFAKPKLLEPGKTFRYEIDLWATSNVFLPGHRIRVEISSSNFPRFDRNPNTGHKFGHDAECAVARQTIYHDKDRPSHILLPVIPR